ncbi:hypothetical protein GW17_00035142 [Ensete ventricosum]|nr:hypothetical protein GW17_00035142 [Ensete ventricosum]
MCFSEKVDKMAVGQIEVTQRRVLAAFNEIHDFSYFPKITKLMFRKLWNRLVALRLRQEDVFIPLNKEEDGDFFVLRSIRISVFACPRAEDESLPTRSDDRGGAKPAPSDPFPPVAHGIGGREHQWRPSTSGHLGQVHGSGDGVGREVVGTAGEVLGGQRRRGGGHNGGPKDQDVAVRGGEKDMPCLNLAMLHLKFFVANLLKRVPSGSLWKGRWRTYQKSRS